MVVEKRNCFVDNLASIEKLTKLFVCSYVSQYLRYNHPDMDIRNIEGLWKGKSALVRLTVFLVCA